MSSLFRLIGDHSIFTAPRDITPAAAAAELACLTQSSVSLPSVSNGLGWAYITNRASGVRRCALCNNGSDARRIQSELMFTRQRWTASRPPTAAKNERLCVGRWSPASVCLKPYIHPSRCCQFVLRLAGSAFKDGTVSAGDRCIHAASGRDAKANALSPAVAAAAASASAQFDQIGVR